MCRRTRDGAAGGHQGLGFFTLLVGTGSKQLHKDNDEGSSIAGFTGRHRVGPSPPGRPTGRPLTLTMAPVSSISRSASVDLPEREEGRGGWGAKIVSQAAPPCLRGSVRNGCCLHTHTLNCYFIKP